MQRWKVSLNRVILKANGFDISLQNGGDLLNKNENGVVMIPYIEHRAMMYRQRKIIKRLSVALGVVSVIAIACFVKGVL